MDIKRAKQEIKDSVEAYLAKDRFGEYQIPALRQRPILLMGPPGIGKTQIMEQIARECGIGLVAYTITHHTRQSAVGLPFIKEKDYGGVSYSVTEYTMSEIIASVYEKMEQTGLSEGILFIDEINCVSETLAPTMLQFLQCKTFGNQKVPEGWIIVGAGNPPEYNKSVREFDVVTLDRIKMIDVEASYDVWKEYAYKAGIHPAVMAYLEIRQNHFYKMETTVDGKAFVTARGWEDLSEFIKAYENLGKTADRDVVFQYIRHMGIAKEFANYLELYRKYRKDYKIDEILKGSFTDDMLEKLKFAPFDERLSIVHLLNGKLNELFVEYAETDAYVGELFSWLKDYMEEQSMEGTLLKAREAFREKKKADQLAKDKERIWRQAIDKLESYAESLKREKPEDEQKAVRTWFKAETENRDKLVEKISEALLNVFVFMEKAFGDGQEMVVFITELNINFYSVRFIQENGCDPYYKYNKGLLFDERQEGILERLRAAENMV
ncbi:AAA family ATPase [Anaerostipes sp.]|uniref:AAA family ATPase n=1 Tax=Anaerostipes sp. TaxID=1872530 RepID=UPI0025C2B66D|nr:AAA family ATPase [Anaerostipes sp.]MBS7007614.1 AAA family ATPase [Anaerostipes sp.]